MKGEPINADRVGQRVAQHGLDWCYSHETGSTNADALNHYSEHRREVIAFSEAQSAGRGRRGRQWHSPYASNLYCTIGLLKTLPANRQGLMSIATGIALCRALQRATEAKVELKWPNDVLHDGQKLGGILIESRPHDAETFFFAIGFGLNIFMRAQELANIAQPATSLERVAARRLDRSELLTATIEAVVQSIRALDPVDTQSLITEFANYDAFHGQPVEVISVDRKIRGINRGIAVDGQLQLETEAGIELHSAAEISLRPGA